MAKNSIRRQAGVEHNSYNAPLKLTDTSASTLWIDLCLTKEVFEILLMYYPAKNGCCPAFITEIGLTWHIVVFWFEPVYFLADKNR